MSIDFDKFLAWAESRFDNIIVKDNEIKINSIFCEDYKHHLWCNPSGGKNKYPHGVYHCWKTDQKGSLVNLVMQFDKCSYEDALDILDGADIELNELEKKVQEIFDQKTIEPKSDQKEIKSLEIPPNCYLFSDLPSSNYIRKYASDYLKNRKIPEDNLYVCTQGRYKNRIVIPYYDRQGNLIYYNGRYIGNEGTNLRYLGPPKELGIGKSDVLFVPEWPEKQEKIYITEGEFDAISLSICGFKSVALGGKVLSEKQFSMIKDQVPVLSFDSDDAGSDALVKIANFLLSKGITNIYYVRPCKEFKDWNGMLVNKCENVIKNYIKLQEKKYNSNPAIGDWESLKINMGKI